MGKNWVWKQKADESKIEEMSQFLNINKHLANLLLQRGIDTFDKAKNFFRPQLSQLYDPFLMKDMDLAVTRIHKAIQNNERILVFGDYDVDGTTAVALVYMFLKELTANVGFYIPDRYGEGYGISVKSIDYATEHKFSLVIVLDCGIKAIEKIEYAKSKGIDYIICDHHRPGDEIPKAVAVLDPKREDCNYPFEELSGCGVGFKLIQAYAKKYGIHEKNLYRYLDLVVISIASDIVPIVDENRIMAFYGLKLINMRPRPGIEAILSCCAITRNSDNPILVFNKELSVNDLVFLIGPRLNAAGRMETGNDSVKLLVSKDIDTANIYAKKINTYNTERKSLDNTITQEAVEAVDKIENIEEIKSIVIYNPSWHKGVIGIVASRLAETYHKPTIVFCFSNGLITGSARSTKEYDIYSAIDSCNDILEHFGGHKFAAGLSIKPENLDKFRERFNNFVENTIEDSQLLPEIEIDADIELKDITPKFFNILKQFAPFGPGNNVPVFSSTHVADSGYSKLVGKNHIKLSLIHKHISGFPVEGIAFQHGKYFTQISKGTNFNICYTIEQNEWNGKKNLQLNIKDIQIEP